jgi:outer membrane receptor protein involved in Fe transport
MRRLWAPLVGVAAAASALSAQARDSTRDTTRAVEVEPIRVTATAVQTRASAPPVVTITVGAAAIRRAQATTPYDLVRRLAGIEVHEHGQGPGFAADAVLRGFTSDHSSDVLLVVDGVPINLPVHGHVEGYADWSMLAAPALREIDVINGPASPLYGDFAFGGVVEARTDVDDRGASAGITSSSDADVGGWLRAGGRGERSGGLLTLQGQRNEGWREHAGYWLGNALVRGWRAVGAGRLEGGVSLYGSRWDSPGFLSVAQYNAGDLRAAGDPTDGGDAYRAILQGRYTGVIGSGGIQATAWAQSVRSVVFLNLPDEGVLEQNEERDRHLAAGGRLEVLGTVLGGDLTVGAEVQRVGSAYDLFHTQARTRLEQIEGYDGDYTSGGLYARWRAIAAGRVALDLGGRLDGLHYASVDRLSGSLVPRTKTDWLVSPKLGARVAVTPEVMLLGSVSRGFRGAPGVLADPSVPPMTAWAGELGVRLTRGPFAARLAAFRLNVSHERIQDPVTREISNTGASVRQGLSADLSLLVRGITLTGSVIYNDATISQPAPSLSVVRGPALERAGAVVPAGASPSLIPELHVEPLEPGDPVPGVGKYVGRLVLGVPVGSAAVGRLTWRFSGPFSPIGEPGTRTRPYGVLDVGGSVPLPLRDVALDLELENALNVRYPEVRASGFLNPGTRRTLRAALRIGGSLITPQP